MHIHVFAEQLERELNCRIGFAFHDLRSGERIAYRGDDAVSTASLIKLPILFYIALEAADNRLDWDEQLVLSDAVKVQGSGILKELSAGLAMSVRDLCMLMTALSDNTATNMLIDRVGIAAINTRLAELGMARTRLLRRAFTPETAASRPFGLGVTTPHEMADLLARIARPEPGDGAVTAPIQRMLAAQQDRAAIPRLLPESWQYAGKTGAIETLRADAAILSGPDGQQIALAVFCAGLANIDWTVDNPGLLAIARLARELVIG